jgi:hypothetical protein
LLLMTFATFSWLDTIKVHSCFFPSQEINILSRIY